MSEHDAAYYERHFADRGTPRLSVVEGFLHPSTVCEKAGHIDNCQGRNGGQHELIAGEAVVVEPIRAVVVAQPGQALVAQLEPTGPAHMIDMATHLASALKDIVERQRLYTVISGKKFPQVEAWMTIGRMDNVVAREAERPIRNDDGSYEAFVELVRLSDGMVIGRASALCGTPDDKPWNGRSEPNRRSMAVTRATSRAFRQQYSWIMALAGYEPTPADEMPPDQPKQDGGFIGTEARPAPPRLAPRENATTGGDGLIGTAIAQGTQDFELRQSPDGYTLPFRVKNGSKSFIVLAEGPLAAALGTIKDTVKGQRVTVWGRWSTEKVPARGEKPAFDYQVLHLDRIATPDGILPTPATDTPMFSDEEQARIDDAVAATA